MYVSVIVVIKGNQVDATPVDFNCATLITRAFGQDIMFAYCNS